ncbi:MAG: alpha-amylase family glycosyl hydrolase [Eubacteriaceae bacterium]|jgi:tRNA(adenine34) deaminase
MMMKTEDRNLYHIFTMGFCGAEATQAECAEQQHRLGKIQALIPYLKRLGTNTVLMGPLFSSVSHGYDTTDYRTVDKRLGTNQELKELVDAFHEAGIEVVLDCVFNHVGRDFFAVHDLLENREQARCRDWFVDVNFGGNNAYNDGLWYADWAGCANLVKLNLWNPEVRNYLKETMASWIDEYGIDGVRLDAANVMNPDFLAELSDYARSLKPGFFLFGEIVGGDYGNFVRSGHLDSCTNYECYKGMYSALNDRNYFEIAHSIRRLMAPGGLCNGFYPANFVDNHDVNRVASTLRDEKLLTPLYILLYTMPGFPSIYYGSEQGIKGEKGNGTDAPLRPPAEAMHFDEQNGLYQIISKLAAVRAASPALRDGVYGEGFIRSEQYGFIRDNGTERVCVVLNMNENPQNAPANLHGSYTDVLSGEKLELDGDVPVGAYSGRILFKTGKEPEDLMKDKQDTCRASSPQRVVTVEHPGKPPVEVIENIPTQPEERAVPGGTDSSEPSGDDDPDGGETGAGSAEGAEGSFAPQMNAFMAEALKEAELAASEGEVPVGAVVVKDGSIIARGHNEKEQLQDPTAHAEMLAIRRAAHELGRYRLQDCALYVTAEPCPMCLGAVIQARLGKLVYGAPELRYGAVETTARLGSHPMMSNDTEIYAGVREEECRSLLQRFFDRGKA